MTDPLARPDTAAAAPAKDTPRSGWTTIYGYCRLRGVPQNCLQHHLRQGVLEPALDAQRRLDIAHADRLLAAITWPSSRLGKAVRQALPGKIPVPPALPARPAPPSPPERGKRPRQWQEKPLPDPLAQLTEAERTALGLLRRRGFEVVPQPDEGRQDRCFKVEGQMLGSAAMVAKAQAMQAREGGLRAGQARSTHQAAPAALAVDGHADRLDDPAAARLLDRVRRMLAELAATVTRLEVLGIDSVCLREAIGPARPAGKNVFHVLGTLAEVACRPGAECSESPLTSPVRAKRPGRKPLDPAKAAAAVQLVAAGLSPAVAACRLGLGRSTVYREVRRASSS